MEQKPVHAAPLASAIRLKKFKSAAPSTLAFGERSPRLAPWP
jgi:hypothetical protein